MFRNYLKIAIRSLLKHKGFTAINISGLATGIGACLLIVLFIRHELSYDRYNTLADRIVRVVLLGKMQGGDIKEANVMPPVAQTLQTDYPEVQQATRIHTAGTSRIMYGEKMFRDDQMAFVDSNFFQVFSLPLTRGDAKTALSKPNALVITEAVAQKFFGTADPLGTVLQIKDNNTLMTVTGVMPEMPENSHFHFDLFASMASLPESRSDSWMISGYFTYLVLPEGYNPAQLERKLPQTIDKYAGPQIRQSMGITMDDFNKSGNALILKLQPLTDIHLHSNLSGEIGTTGDIRYLYIFGTVALFMLLIACINFMNLSTASASTRSREVGIRKVMGSLKKQLVVQFMLESVLLTLLATGIALGLVYVLLPAFNALANQRLSLDLLHNVWMIPCLLTFALFTGLLAGSYPAFFLSSFNPIAVLKGRFTSGGKSVGLRSGLVVFQFIISIGLIIGTTVVYKQLSYIRSKKLGYDKEQVLIIQDTHWLGKNFDAFRQQLARDPGVVNVSASGYLPAGPSYGNNFFVYADGQSTNFVKTLRYDVDDEYLPTLGMTLSGGRNFSPEFGTDSTAVILNETAARTFGWGEQALGHTLTHRDNEGHTWTFQVIGIVKDFHFRSLHQLIEPLVMIMRPTNANLIVKVNASAVSGLLATVKNRWTALRVDAPLSYSFLDERFDKMYQAEANTGRILAVFAGLTIFVACLGLFGLATFTAEQRTKEIGIRKVLGARVGGLVSMLSKDFIRLVGIAFLVASPIAWFVMNRWLQDFAYRINIPAWIFVLAGVLATLIALLTISFQALRAAMANPVKSLRAE